MDPVKFVELLELEEHHASELPKRRISSNGLRLATESGKRTAAVDNGSLTSFTANVNGQQKEDVLYGTLLAQLAANKKHNRNTDALKWYNVYCDVMENIGWVIQQFEFKEFHSTKENFTISEVVVMLLVAALGKEADMVKIVKDSLDGLQNSAGGLSLFNSNSVSGKHGNFQILPCTADRNSQVNIALVASHFNTSEVSQNYFFFTWKKQNIHIANGIQICTLNEDHYSRIRQAVKDKLGDRVKEFIENIDI